MKKKLFTYLTLVPFISAIAIFFVSPTVQAEPLVCNMQTFSGEDDVAHQMSLPFNLFLGGSDHSQIYLTTNATMTFGSPDANFWSYPSTPSVSLAGYDWDTWGEGAYVSYGYNSNSFCIEWSVRPFPQSVGDLTQIRLMVNRFNNGNWHGEITTFGWLPPDLRRGIVSQQNGQPLIIEAAFDVIRGVPVEVEPAPVPTSFDAPPQVNCWDGSQANSMDLCPVEPIVTCWDGSTVHYQSECLPIPPPIQCWNGTTVPWNQSCPNVPPPVECWDGSSVNWNAQCPTRTLNPPGNIYGEVRVDGVYISWDAPPAGMTTVERYAVSWMCDGCAGYGWSSNTTSVLIPFSTFNYTGGLGINYTFSIRADNDTTSTYSDNIVGPTLFIQAPTPSAEPTESTQPVEPTPIASPSPSESQSQLPVPAVTPSPSPEQPSLSPLPEAPTQTQSPSPDPSPSSIDLPSDNLTTEEALAEILEEYDVFEAVPFSVLEEAGLDYSDLPPDQPVMLDNGVVLTAEVADALEIFESSDEFFETIITDPGKALEALANVGADMTDQTRHESQQVTVSVIIYAQLMNGLSAANMLMRRI